MTQPPCPITTPPSQRIRRVFGAGSLLALLLSPAPALAQADITPPPPNVLLLVDTSGSMDYKTGSDSFPTCHYAGTSVTAQTSERSRWIDLVEVLSGSISGYDCQKLDRNSTTFKNEYLLGAASPYDALYPNPYHRPMSGTCLPGPGTLDPSNKALFPAGAIKYHAYNNVATTCAFGQASDGILDAFESDVRFALMTFDTDPGPAKDVDGLWSYYLTSPKQGEPAGCLVPQDQEVGVRNAEAPPWEGRAVGFGDPALGSVDYKSRNAMIQQVLLATRPYGATPIAGMLDDARTFMLSDNTADPLNSSVKFGPMSDPAKDCRHKSIVLLSDGQPNMDLRPFCEPAGCPYDKAEDIAQDLKSKGVDIYVIGFALSKVTVNGNEVACKDFAASDFDATNNAGICKMNPNSGPIQACCALNRIAAAGGHASVGPDDPDWRRARFADNRDELRAALSQAIGGNFKSTTRTPFVNAAGGGFVQAGADLTFARAFRFAASFKPGKLDKPWVGELNRSRYVCKDVSGVIKPVLEPVDATKGDKFVDNVNNTTPSAAAGVATNGRTLFSVVGDAPIVQEASMRPNLPTGVTDGVGTYKGTQNLYSSTLFATTIPATALKVTDTTCDSTGVDLDANQCRDRYLKWLVGLPNNTPYSRCASGVCNLVAEIYHSVPRAVAGKPSQFLVDSSYQAFTKQQVDAKRPAVLYASSNDGFLHAFKIAAVTSDNAESMKVKTLENNELWAFVPPGVLPRVPSLYPGTHQLLLDGTPAIREVVATRDEALIGYKYRLERNVGDARLGQGAWRNILVQSYGAKHPGYFAIDVTDPVVSATGGPKFLWQLNTDSAGNPLFGNGGGTPLITTVFIGGKEVAVAILPGGYTSAPVSPTDECTRKTTDFSNFETDYLPRTKVRCYTGEAVRARSLTVVRLDDGQILRTFRQAAAEMPTLNAAGKVTVAPLDSPMTGTPVAFPADVGSVADRVFIGDQDGALWRLNFASTANSGGNPADWALELFFDGFPKANLFSHTAQQGQPITSVPIISVDNSGNLTVAFSTGDQEAIGAAAGLANYVWSLTEKPTADRLKLQPRVNWHLALKNALSGDRVIGEMALFSGDLYFTTVGPDSAGDACSSGSGKVWGMHYIDSKGAKSSGNGGKPAASLGTLIGSNGYVDATTLLGSDAHAYLSGVSVGQQPTCDSPSAGNDDDFFSYGAVTQSHGAITPGRYQLIIPTGDRTSNSGDSRVTPITQGGVNAVAIDLASPPVMNYVDSWAAIVE
jgi:type IV pilus assembly protein PilY1